MKPDTGFKHIIWDWNGTLFDDAWLAVDILNHVRTRHGMPTVTLDWYRDTFVTPVKDFYVLMGFDFKTHPYEMLADEWFSEYEERRFECKLYDDAEPTLTACAEAGVTQSVLSMYPSSSLEQLVSQYGVRDYFAHLIGLDNHFASGKVERGRQLIERLKHDPNEVVLIGDTVHDHEVADAMGVHCALVPRGHQSRAKLASRDATLLDTLTDLQPLIR